MKKHSQMLKGLLGIIAGITLLLALALPAFAEQDVTLSVIVRDENSDPLKGAVFTLVSNVENDKPHIPLPLRMKTAWLFSQVFPKTANLTSAKNPRRRVI